VEFTGPPGSMDVQISTYINNLHPANREIYSAIETVISGSIKQWNEILVRNKWKGISHSFWFYNPCPRESIRIRTYGVEGKPSSLSGQKDCPPRKTRANSLWRNTKPCVLKWRRTFKNLDPRIRYTGIRSKRKRSRRFGGPVGGCFAQH
jgi:hypothetical protein